MCQDFVTMEYLQLVKATLALPDDRFSIKPSPYVSEVSEEFFQAASRNRSLGVLVEFVLMPTITDPFRHHADRKKFWAEHEPTMSREDYTMLRRNPLRWGMVNNVRLLMAAVLEWKPEEFTSIPRVVYDSYSYEQKLELVSNMRKECLECLRTKLAVGVS